MTSAIERPIWWWSLFHGIIAIVLGLLAVVVPVGHHVVLFGAIGVLLVVEGVWSLLHGLSARRAGRKPWVAVFINSLVFIPSGIATLALVYLLGEDAALALLWIYAADWLISGLSVAVIAGIMARRERSWGFLGGVFSTLAGIMLVVIILVMPVEQALRWLPAPGVMMLFHGVGLVVGALQAKAHLARKLEAL